MLIRKPALFQKTSFHKAISECMSLLRAGEGFGSYMKSVKYKDKKSAAKASVEEAKKWMWQNRDNLVYYPDYGLPYTFKLPENSNEI